MAKLGEFAVEIFINGVKTFLEFFFGELAYGVMGWVVVHIRQEDGLREGGLDMLSRAAVTVAASANLQENGEKSSDWDILDAYFVVERTVDSVLFRTEDVSLQT